MIKIEKINLKQVIHNIKEAYLSASKDTEAVTYGNISEKIANMGGDGVMTATASTFEPAAQNIEETMSLTVVGTKSSIQSFDEVMPITASTLKPRIQSINEIMPITATVIKEE